MSIYEAIGMAWVVFTAALANVAIIVLAYRHLAQMKIWAERGAVEEKRDAVEAFKVREVVDRG